ncbi:5-(carboxyamino)imidazole ribonucleotide synthase [Metabacillus herbersteinensis]|uniref:N5-carboxyaminoimidazole ribonucleotide synthase n=1 Tax=Metabacillus herbersteinensis TaxID=283816 RepID=A0ABV6GHP6_9BACI
MSSEQRFWKAVINLSNTIIYPGATIGIIGGGQLGRMMAIAAKSMGYQVAVLDPTKNSPCGQVSDHEITAEYNDLDAIKELAKISDVITYEFENIDYQALKWLEKHAYLPQQSSLLLVTQDRETEKQAIQNAGGTVAPYAIVKNEEELVQAIQKLDFPCVLKTCRGGYDGKGQAVLKNESHLVQAKELLKHGTCILEKWISFEKELSVIVTRSGNGETKTFPVAENIHKENILYQTIIPARVPDEIILQAEQEATKLANAFDLIGTLAVELFLTSDGEVFVNELAPRPHNSGHYTLDFCETDQFEQQIRAICNLPLGRTTMIQKGIMVNVLGENLELINEHLSMLANAKLYLYGKKEANPKRKMGHINFIGSNHEELLEKINVLWGHNRTEVPK